MVDPGLLQDGWGIDMACECRDISIAGSPERAAFRTVIEDRSGIKFILEAISSSKAARKRSIAQALEQVSSQGVKQVVPYLRSVNGDFIYEYDGRYWQIVSFVPGIPLPRPEYVFDLWRGVSAAEFLLLLREHAPEGEDVPLDLLIYIEKLMVGIRHNRPDVLPKVQVMYSYLKEHLVPFYKDLPLRFAHGDYHMMNLIWQESGIAAVIDWEFCGLRPELYDAANMVSCLGIEDPQSLWSGAAVPFLRRLKASGKFDGISFSHFLPLMVALRFAWLSEWLRRNDNDMIQMEFDYFDILTARADDLSEAWGLSQ